MKVVEASNVNKFHGARLALVGVNFRLSRGEKAALLGLSGSGKSTLMRILTGYLSPTFGFIKVHGQDPRLPRARAGFGYVPEGAPLPERMRVGEYLRFRATLRGLDRKKAARAVTVVSRRCRLGAGDDRLIASLPRLDRLKTAVADALLGDPEILFLDDPTLDFHREEAAEARECIAAAAAGRTLFLAGRSLVDAERLCRRALVLDNGKVVMDGDLAQLVENGIEESELWLEIMTRQPVRETLRSIPGVRAVSVQADEVDQRLARVRLITPAGVDLRREITQACAARGWLITEMRLEPPRLEDVFRRLNKG